MSSHEHANVSLVREGLAAMDKGDVAWMEDHLADDVVWHIGGNNRMSGEYRGKETILKMFAGTSSQDGPISVDTHDVVGNDEHVVALGTAVVTVPDMEPVEYRYVNVFHIQDGKVTEAWGMSENDAQTDPIWDKLAESM